MEKLKEMYKMGKFQFDAKRFCGKNFATQKDGSVTINQEHFVQEKIAPIKLTPERRKQRYSKCSPWTSWLPFMVSQGDRI